MGVGPNLPVMLAARSAGRLGPPRPRRRSPQVVPRIARATPALRLRKTTPAGIPGIPGRAASGELAAGGRPADPDSHRQRAGLGPEGGRSRGQPRVIWCPPSPSRQALHLAASDGTGAASGRTGMAVVGRPSRAGPNLSLPGHASRYAHDLARPGVAGPFRAEATVVSGRSEWVAVNLRSRGAGLQRPRFHLGLARWSRRNRRRRLAHPQSRRRDGVPVILLVPVLATKPEVPQAYTSYVGEQDGVASLTVSLGSVGMTPRGQEVRGEDAMTRTARRLLLEAGQAGAGWPAPVRVGGAG